MHERFECPQHGPVAHCTARCSPPPTRWPGSPRTAMSRSGSRGPFQGVGSSRYPARRRRPGAHRSGGRRADGSWDVRGTVRRHDHRRETRHRAGRGLGRVSEPDPDLTTQPATTKIRAAGWPTPLWHVDTPGPRGLRRRGGRMLVVVRRVAGHGVAGDRRRTAAGGPARPRRTR